MMFGLEVDWLEGMLDLPTGLERGDDDDGGKESVDAICCNFTVDHVGVAGSRLLEKRANW